MFIVNLQDTSRQPRSLRRALLKELSAPRSSSRMCSTWTKGNRRTEDRRRSDGLTARYQESDSEFSLRASRKFVAYNRSPARRGCGVRLHRWGGCKTEVLEHRLVCPYGIVTCIGGIGDHLRFHTDPFSLWFNPWSRSGKSRGKGPSL